MEPANAGFLLLLIARLIPFRVNVPEQHGRDIFKATNNSAGPASETNGFKELQTLKNPLSAGFYRLWTGYMLCNSLAAVARRFFDSCRMT